VTQRVTPVVAFGPADPSVPGFTVGEDDVSRIRVALEFLAGRGYRCTTPVCSRLSWGGIWLKQYEEALQQARLDISSGCVLRLGEEMADAVKEVERLRRDCPACDALVVDTDMHALHTLRALEDGGVSIPGDMGVVGLRGTDMAMHHSPRLTTVANTYSEMIRFAANEIQKANWTPLPHMHVDFVGEVVPGRTTR
jgi:DNA-binding LacI/PurR family transcriptional regulator